jgi:septum formation protein
MLRRLSGRSHVVHTALALVTDSTAHEVVDSARVQFVDLTDEMIRWYVATGEPMDKAGAYAIQGLGGLLVAGVEGSPHTVVGLPVHRLPELFAAHDLDFWSMLTKF